MYGVLRRGAVTKRCGRRIFGVPTTDLREKGDGRGIQYGGRKRALPAGGRGVAGAACGVPAGAVLVPVAVPGRPVRARRRGADRAGTGGLAAVPEPGARVPPGPRHGLP